MCASCQLPCSDANPPWLVPTGNWAQTGAKQTQEGNMAHGNPLPLSLLLFISLSLSFSLSSLFTLPFLIQNSPDKFLFCFKCSAHILSLKQFPLAAWWQRCDLWEVQIPTGGCRVVPEFKSRAGICASKGSTVFHCSCSVSAGWPCDSPTCWDSSVRPHKSQSGKGREWVHPKKCSFELVTVTRGSCRSWEG